MSNINFKPLAPRTVFLPPAGLVDIAPGCVAAWKSDECHARCQSAWLPTCPRERTAFLPLVSAHERGVKTFHTVNLAGSGCKSGRLTKTFLMAVPSGSFLVSNVGSIAFPIFAEVIASSMPERLEQWARIVWEGADGRLCYVYQSQEIYDRLRGDFDAENRKQKAIRAEKRKLKAIRAAQAE